MAILIAMLRSAVEKYLGQTISGAAVTLPHLPALYGEDLEDAFEYLGLIHLTSSPYWLAQRYCEPGAVYAGHGFGLCTNYTDIPA